MAKKKTTANKEETALVLFSIAAEEITVLKARVEKLEKQSGPPHLRNREVRG